MTRIITDAEYDELWEEALQNGDITCHSDGFDSVFKWKHEFAEQYYRKIQLPLGLRINIFEDESQTSWSRGEQHSERHPLTLAFQLTGSCRVLTNSLKDGYYAEKAGENYLFFTPGIKEVDEYPSQERLLRARIRLYPGVLRALSEGQVDSLPSQLKPLIESDSAPIFHMSIGKTTPAMQQAWQQILSEVAFPLNSLIDLFRMSDQLSLSQMVGLCSEYLEPVMTIGKIIHFRPI